MKINSTFLSQEEVERLHRATVKVLEEVGIEFCSEEALQLFREKGVKVEGRRVFIDEKTLDACLKTAPSSFEMRGKTNQDTLVIGDGRTVYAPASGPVYVREGQIRRSTTSEDYINLLKIYQTSDVIPVININMTEPQDIPIKKRNEFRIKQSLKITSKPLMGITTGYHDSLECVRTIKDFYETNTDHVVVGIISPVSPLMYDESMIEAMQVYASENQPMIIATCSLPGATSPVTLAGTLVTNNAEVLAGIVYTQLINPGIPIIYGGTSTACDMRTVSPSIGSPETGLLAYGVRALSRRYGIPCRGGGSMTDAKIPDYQAGIESTYGIISPSIAGVDFVVQSCGILESFNVLCFEKILLDEENIKYAKRYVNGFVISDETIAFDTIKEISIGGTYLQSEHTFKHYKNDFYTSKFMSKDSFSRWQEKGSMDIAEKARQEVVKRLEQYTEPALTAAQQSMLAGY